MLTIKDIDYNTLFEINIDNELLIGMKLKNLNSQKALVKLFSKNKNINVDLKYPVRALLDEDSGRLKFKLNLVTNEKIYSGSENYCYKIDHVTLGYSNNYDDAFNVKTIIEKKVLPFIKDLKMWEVDAYTKNNNYICLMY